jgi:SAM-dependent methyltransferase
MNEEWEKNAKLVEFGWWTKKYVELEGGLHPERYKKYREDGFSDMIAMFNGKFKPKGDVVNIGTGLMSIFNFIDVKGRMVEVDPIIDKYLNTFPLPSEAKFEAMATTSGIKDNSFDTALCLNTIDHTSEPEKMASEIHRILKRGGTLYFEVNFDRYSSPAHYQVFGRGLVRGLFEGRFKTVFENMKMDCGPLKNWDEYYAIMVKT